jgi:hypothetical protein
MDTSGGLFAMNHVLPACILLFLAVATAHSADDALQVVNGDFSDLTGLQERAGGWYAGVPSGWSAMVSVEGSTNYSIRKEAGDFVANVSALSQTQPSFAAFTQEVGRLSAPGEVTVTFELKEPWHSQEFYLGAAIYDSMSVLYPLAVGNFTNCGAHTLTASNVPAGTQIKIGFWSALGFPGLDNVKVTVRSNE